MHLLVITTTKEEYNQHGLCSIFSVCLSFELCAGFLRSYGWHGAPLTRKTWKSCGNAVWLRKMTKDGDSNDSCVICPNVGLQNTKLWHPFGLPSCPLREFTPSDTLASWMMCNSDITITSNVCFSSITFLWSWTLQLNYNLMMGSDIGGFIVTGKSGIWFDLHCTWH